MSGSLNSPSYATHAALCVRSQIGEGATSTESSANFDDKTLISVLLDMHRNQVDWQASQTAATAVQTQLLESILSRCVLNYHGNLHVQLMLCRLGGPPPLSRRALPSLPSCRGPCPQAGMMYTSQTNHRRTSRSRSSMGLSPSRCGCGCGEGRNLIALILLSVALSLVRVSFMYNTRISVSWSSASVFVYVHAHVQGGSDFELTYRRHPRAMR